MVWDIPGLLPRREVKVVEQKISHKWGLRPGSLDGGE